MTSPRHRIRFPIVFACLVAVSSCSPQGCRPKLVLVAPQSGPARSIVSFTATGSWYALAWDAESQNERNLAYTFLGIKQFSVPTGAGTGPHAVQLIGYGGRSNIIEFTVTEPRPSVAPRIDHVTLAGTSFPSSGRVNTWLLIQGANIDIGASVEIGNVIHPSFTYRTLNNNLFDIDPATLDFPIYHYSALVSLSFEIDAGSTIVIRVRNLDQQVTDPFSYTLPMDEITMDSDGDNIPDHIEINGFDTDNLNGPDFFFSAIGANPFRRDIFLELDVMVGLDHPPKDSSLKAVQMAFAGAPILNAGGTNGIHLYIDASGTVPFYDTIDFSNAMDNSGSSVSPDEYYGILKSENINYASVGEYFHYGIWANMRPNGNSGISDAAVGNNNTIITGPGDDLIVSFDDFVLSNLPKYLVKSQASILMHELGHNLKQRHGGHDDVSTTRPNYNSVMSYSWMDRLGQGYRVRLQRPVCFPLFYGQAGVKELYGNVINNFVKQYVDYSDGMGAKLVKTILDEPLGVCDFIAVNWNHDLDAVDLGVAAKPCPAQPPDQNDCIDDRWPPISEDFCNWCALNYRGPEENGEEN